MNTKGRELLDTEGEEQNTAGQNTPKKQVRVGIIGPSWWVNFWHLPAIQNHPNALVTAVCGTSARSPEEVAAKYGPDARYYTDVNEMLDNAPLDGVIVCTPNDLHYPSAMAALERGLHVTCEKPLALSANQAREMAHMARQRGLVGMTNFPYRDNPCVQALRRLVQEGYIGELLHITGQYNGGFGLSRPPGWRGLRERSGAGILGDLGSHLIDLARYVTRDEFASVCAHSLTVLRNEKSGEYAFKAATDDPISVASGRNDDSCAWLAQMASGAQGVFQTSWLAYQGAEGQHQELDASGTLGRLHFVANHAGTFLRGKRAGQEHWEMIPVEGVVAPGPGVGCDEDYFRPGRLTPTNTTYRWIEAIRQGETGVSPGLFDGLKAQQVIDAILAASRERRWVDVDQNAV